MHIKCKENYYGIGAFCKAIATHGKIIFSAGWTNSCGW